jgi:hypothetical protein
MRGHLGFRISRVSPCANDQIDAFFQYVKLLLNFEEMSTTTEPYYIVDNSPDERQVELTATATNPVAAAFETAPQKRFGDKSIRLFDGVNATVIPETGKDFSLSRPCVVEFWLRVNTSVSVNKARILGTDGWGFYLSMVETEPPYSSNRKLEFVVFDKAVRVTVDDVNYKILWSPVTTAGGFYDLVIPEAQFDTAETSAWWGDENAAEDFAAAYADYLAANSLSPDENVKFIWAVVTNIVTEEFGGEEYTYQYRQVKYYYVNSSLAAVAGEQDFATLENEGTEEEFWRAFSEVYFARTAGANDYPGEENGQVRHRVSTTFNARPVEGAPEPWNYVRFLRLASTFFARFSIGGGVFGPTINSDAVFSDYGTPLTIGYNGASSGMYVDEARVTIGSDRGYSAQSVLPGCPFPVAGPEPDALFDSVELLLHLDGDYWNPIPLIDSSTRDRTVSSVGFVQQYGNGFGKFGGAVFFWPGHGGYLSIPYDAAWDLNTGPFAIEFWINGGFGAETGTKIIGTDGWGAFVVAPATFGEPQRLELRSFDAEGALIASVDCGPLNNSAWIYVYISNTDVRIGTTSGGVTQIAATGISFNPSAHGSALTIGGDASGVITAYVDEIRITRASRPVPEIVPALPFPDSGPPPAP